MLRGSNNALLCCVGLLRRNRSRRRNIAVVLLRLCTALLQLRLRAVRLLGRNRSRRLGDALVVHGGPVQRGLGWTSVVLVVELLAIAGCRLNDLRLCRYRSRMALVHCCEFCWPRSHVDTTPATVVADAVRRLGGIADVVVDHRAVINIRVVDVADVVDLAVVVEVMTAPVAAKVADANVAEAVIDAPIEADVRSPVTAMETIVSAVPAPVGRCPERAIVGRRAPHAGKPSGPQAQYPGVQR